MKTLLTTFIIMMVGITSLLAGTGRPIQFMNPNQFKNSSNTADYYPSGFSKPVILYQIALVYKTNYLYLTNIVNQTNTFSVTNYTQVTSHVTITNIVSVTNNPASSSTNYVVASSGSYNDVSYAITVAQTTGAPTVWIPGGTNVWSQGPLVDAGISLLCSNTCSILFNTNSSTGFYLSAQGQFVTISNFVFDVNPTNGPTGSVIDIDGSNVCFRITHCTLMQPSTALTPYNGTTPSGIHCGAALSYPNSINTDGPFGLFDHCNFYFPGGYVSDYLNVQCNGQVTGYCWQKPNSWGTTNNVVIENCNFSSPTNNHSFNSSVVDGWGGLRVVLRYCNITNIVETVHGVNSGAPGVAQGSLELEMYENNWVFNENNPNNFNILLWIRGGSCYFWSNNIINAMGAGQFGINAWGHFSVECASTTIYDPSYCPALLTYPANYPASEQVGQGILTNYVHSYQPICIWSNSWPNVGYNNFYLGTDSGDSPFIKQGIDIFTNTPPVSYTPLQYPHPLNN